MKQIVRMLLSAWTLAFVTMPVFAQEVTLRSENNSVQLTGKLIEFNGETYALETSIGLITLAAEGLSCEGDACPSLEPDLDFAASGVEDLARDLLPGLMSSYALSTGVDLEINPEATSFTTTVEGDSATIDVVTNSSAEGYADLIEGRANLAFTTRAANAAELEALELSGSASLRESILAIGGLVIVMPKEDALPSISIEDTARVFSGEITNWSDIGGPDAQIKLYAREKGSAIAEVFDALVLEPSGRQMSGDALYFSSDEALAARVAADPLAIGFTGYSVDNAAYQLPVIGQCGLIVTPSDFNVRAEEYPLTYRLRIVTKEEAQSSLLEDLLLFASTDAAQEMVAAAGQIDQSLIRTPVDQQGMRFASALQSAKVVDAIPRLQTMVSEMVVSERLSATLRFEAGSQQLDERGRADIGRIVRMLQQKTATGPGKTVRLMGFTDSLGNPDLNQELSIRRANRVLDAILEVDPALTEKVDFLPMGFGDVSPIGCDQSVRGRWINRRVEVWISANRK